MWARVTDLLDGLVPGISSLSVVVCVDGVERFHHTVGCARLDPQRAAEPDQVYDLASLTKALVGSTVAAALAAEARLDLDATVPGAPPGVTTLQLLQHVSGWPAWAPLYGNQENPGTPATRERIIDAAFAVAPVATAGTRYAYSDVGFVALLRVLERAGGAPLDVLFQRLICDRAGMDVRFGWPGAAATELCPLRGRMIEGEVHDPNAWWMGGICAHAGLFGSARAVAGLCDALRVSVERGDAALAGPDLRRLWNCRGLGSHVGGWDTPSRGGYTSTGASFPDDAVGHLGYTGTSAWIVPSRRTVVVVLTNRIHPVDDKAAIRAARPVIHDAVAAALGWTS